MSDGSGVGAVVMRGIGGAVLQVCAIAVAGANLLLPCSISLPNRIRDRIKESGEWLVQSITALLPPLPHCASQLRYA